MGRAIAVLAGMLLACEAAAVTTGTDLLGYCAGAESEATVESGICRGYVSAVADMMTNYPFAGLKACLPFDVTTDQLVSVSSKYLRDHPGVLHLSAYTNIAAALVLAYPCQRRR